MRPRGSRAIDTNRIARRFQLPRRSIALIVLLALPGAAAADPPRLTPDEVAGLMKDAGPACVWRFVATTAARPDGAVERWRASECAAAGMWNLRLDAGSDGRLAVTVLLPGDTRQPPAVQEAATLAVLARAADDGCRERRVVDTTVVATTAARSVERWSVVACGQRRDYQLTFTASGAGAPSIGLEPAGETASVPTALSR